MSKNEIFGKNFQHELDSARRDASNGTSLDARSDRHPSPPTVQCTIATAATIEAAEPGAPRILVRVHVVPLVEHRLVSSKRGASIGFFYLQYVAQREKAAFQC